MKSLKKLVLGLSLLGALAGEVSASTARQLDLIWAGAPEAAKTTKATDWLASEAARTAAFLADARIAPRLPAAAAPFVSEAEIKKAAYEDVAFNIMQIVPAAGGADATLDALRGEMVTVAPNVELNAALLAVAGAAAEKFDAVGYHADTVAAKELLLEIFASDRTAPGFALTAGAAAIEGELPNFAAVWALDRAATSARIAAAAAAVAGGGALTLAEEADVQICKARLVHLAANATDLRAVMRAHVK